MWFEWVESNGYFGPLAVFVFGDLRQSLLRSLRFSSLRPPDLRHKVLGFRLSGTLLNLLSNKELHFSITDLAVDRPNRS